MSQIETSRSGWKGVLICCCLVIIVVVVLVVWCKWWPAKCPICKPCPTPVVDGQIVLEDTHASAWMVFDNDWIKESGRKVGETDICVASDKPEDVFGKCDGNYVTYPQVTDEEAGHGHDDPYYRDGALFQLGEVAAPGGNEAHFKDIVLTLTNGTEKTLTPWNHDGTKTGEFDWIDINQPGAPCPIDALHAYTLFEIVPNPIVNQVPLVVVECDAAQTTQPSHAHCLRGRALHSSYQPNIGVVTFWSGEDRYRIQAHDTIDPNDVNHKHVGYTFELFDPVYVDVWNRGCFQSRHTVKKVLIRYALPAATHTPFHQTPMDGGPIVQP